MTREPGPPPPLVTHPNGIVIDQPKYLFYTKEWTKAPTLKNESFRTSETVISRDQNDADYFSIGNQTTWHMYVILGYHFL
jgi:hypothetical protein